MRVILITLLLSCTALAQNFVEQAHALNYKLYQAWSVHEHTYNYIYGHLRSEKSVTKAQAKQEEAQALQSYDTALIPLIAQAITLRAQIFAVKTENEEDLIWDQRLNSGDPPSKIADQGFGVYLEKLARRK